MADYTIPLSYVVNATTVPASRGLQPLQLGTILLLTEDAPVSILDSDYIISRTASGVTNVFGTENITAKMVNTIFAQTPNILNANGYVIVAPYKEAVVTPATSGTLTTADLSSNLSAITGISDGDLALVIDSEAQTLTGLDFRGATTLEDVAAIIQADLVDATVAASGDTLVFTSDSTGLISTVEMVAASGAGTDLYGSSYFDGANATEVDGVDAVTAPETTAQAIERLAEQIYFEGILTTKDLGDAEATAASNLVEGMQNSILFLTAIDTAALGSSGIFDTLKSNDNTRKLLYLYGVDDTAKKANAKLFAAAFASRGLSVNYAGSNSTITMTYKDLVNVPVDTNISESVLNTCETVGADVYCSIEGLPKVISFKQGGLYFDELANQIWLRTTVQTTVANVLFTTRNKIPQTTQGVNTLVNAVNGVLNQGVINGMIAAGEWNSPDTFGVYEDFMRNIRTFGYYTYYTPLAEQSQADREARKCPVISIAVKQAGAIEHANIIIYVES